MNPDMDVLLAPIAAEAACGADLSLTPLFDEIAEARRADDPSLAQGEWVTALKLADWPCVFERCHGALAKQTKDLRLAGWLTEALAQKRSFAGLALGLGLIDRLCEQYWDALHPLPEAGDAEARIGNFTWLVARLSRLVPELPLTAGTVLAVSYHEHQSAQALRAELERDPDGAAGLAEGRITMADVVAAAVASGDAFYRELLSEQSAAIAAAERLAQRIDAKLGSEGPSFTPLIQVLAEVRRLMQQLAETAGLQLARSHVPAANPAAIESRADAGVARAPGGTLRTRSQALAQLREVAEFFRRSEPHSPVAYLAERAARWGELPLHAWLRSVVKDEAALLQLEELLGVERLLPTERTD